MRPSLHRLHVESRSTHNSSRSRLPMPPWQPSPDFPLLLAHCLGFACSIFVLAWVLRFRGGLPLIAHNQGIADDKDLIFNVHPVMMLVGYIVLASEAILVFKGVPGTKRYKKAVHLTVQGIALVMAVLGIWAAYKFHNIKGIDDFYSLHSWLGLGTIVLFGFQWIMGYAIFWYPGVAGKTRIAMLPWHVFLGLFVYCLALVTAETGLLEKLTFLIGNKVIGRYSMEAMFVNSIGLLLVTYGTLVILAVVIPKAHKEHSTGSMD